MDANRTGTNQRTPDSGGGSAAQTAKAIAGGIDDLPSDVVLLDGSDAFDTDTLDPAWVVTNATAGAINPINTTSAPLFSSTERVGSATRIGGLLLQGNGGFAGASCAFFGRSITALADGESLTISCDMPVMDQPIVWLGNSTTATPAGTSQGVLLDPFHGFADYGQLIAGSGALVGNANIPTSGGRLTFWLSRVGGTVYMGLMVGDTEFLPLTSFLSALLGAYVVFGAGSNVGNCVLRPRWVRHTATAADGSWPWERT